MDSASKPVFGIFCNAISRDALEAVNRAIEGLLEREIPFILEQDAHELLFKDRNTAAIEHDSRDAVAARADFIITFGGDGTLLRSAQAILPYQTPIFGVNLGKMGFLSDVLPDEIFDAVEKIISGDFSIEHRTTITGTLDKGTNKFHALNDIVVGKSGSAKVINIDAWVNDEFLASFLADGLIVSTPTGSTAYSLATGGPVVTPSSDVLLISPISAHTLTARPVIVSCDSRVAIRAHTEEGAITVMCDGRMIADPRDRIELNIEKGLQTVPLVKKIGPDYFETLRVKLSWAHDGRQRHQ